MKKCTIRIYDDNVFKRMKKLAVDLDTSIQDLLVEAFKEYEQKHCTSSAKRDNYESKNE